MLNVTARRVVHNDIIYPIIVVDLALLIKAWKKNARATWLSPHPKNTKN
jgi:hypothetical protein